MLESDDLILNSSEKKILYAIYITLQEILREIRVQATLSATREQAVRTMPVSAEGLLRNDILALFKALPDQVKPEMWSRLSNAELLKLLRKEGVVK